MDFCWFSLFFFFSSCLYSTLASTDCTNLKVKPIDQLPGPYKKNLNIKFYKKFVSANGIPIMGPRGISDYALKECARILNGVTRNLRPGFLDALIAKQERISLWAKDSNACSIPEVAKPCTLQDFHGGLAFGNILILQETSFNCDNRGNAWIGRVLIHEFSHGVNSVFGKVDSNLQKSLQDAYKNAKDKGLWGKDEYAMTNDAEYFAGGVQPWFEANEQDSCNKGLCNGNDLKKKDSKLYDVVSKVFQAPDWLYKCSQACDMDLVIPGIFYSSKDYSTHL